MPKTPDAERVRAAESRAASLRDAVQFYESPALDAETLHVYGRKAAGDALRALIGTDVPALVEAVRALEDEADRLRGDAARAEKEKRAPAAAGKEAAAEPAAEDLGSLLSAPFRVTPAMVSAAKDDPLMALAVQVARGAGAEAGEVDRARLIAMAFAAARGDMETFWGARRKRTGLGDEPAKGAKRKK